ncbi:MAG TPA: tRNA uridine-5-carboxymethylaminomethyl(34) synthesis GTPase MnmE [Bacteroidetes bacterium]|nr:tRNA uridine-5-carboxymethylaminomethyl(34) synthesis GTPase MnmE [Bacteroidota bacterium]HRR08186.1 tRNA uridine-5-carboxymethylaminomethyl(34) synthesis GTPase MnmE [Rhodothermales bacterium]
MQQGLETIVAIATARGRAALAIVRLSGPDAVPIVAACFRGKSLEQTKGHTAFFGYITDIQGNDIDQVVATVFRAPKSATGEDIVEVTCHGGDFAPQLILHRLVQAGARLAEPGEFTQRAFLNGKMDLAQAEAVADLIHASSSMAHRVSLNHLQGRYSAQIMALRAELMELAAMIELELDFAEEDVAFADRDRLVGLLKNAQILLSGLLDSWRVGAFLRDGIRVVIGGRPNAGKSTLLNVLTGRNRAIVSPIAGTTRDEIEVDVEVMGFLFRFVDTAGLRETQDLIEAEGVRRAEHSIRTADILLYVFDAVIGLDEEESVFLTTLKQAQPQLPVLRVANKADLALQMDSFEADFRLSAVHWDDPALEALRKKLVQTATQGLADAEASAVVTNQRHRQHLAKALRHVETAQDLLSTELVSGDRLSLDLRLALHELGAITGEITTEDILGEIFSRFCIGK